MKSPFPGMDPYIERRWRNFHTSMVIYARDRLNESLPPDLAAYSEHRVYVEADGERVRAIYRDVRVSERSVNPSVVAPDFSSTAVAQPVLIDMEDGRNPGRRWRRSGRCRSRHFSPACLSRA